MEFSTKKRICKISAFIVSITSAILMAFPAVAATSTATYNGVGSSIKTVTKETNGTYSNLTAMIGETELHATNTSYYTAPKFVSYYTYKYNGTNFVRIEGGISNGTTRTVTHPLSLTTYQLSILTKRYHHAYMYNPSNGSIADELTIIICRD